MTNQLVTIIIPVYNAEKRLDLSIKSILQQSYKQIELILINDGSTDNSLNICHNYENEDKRIRVINQKNSGVSISRNRGIEISEGDFIMFLDSDDTLDTEAINNLVTIINNDKSDIAIFGMSFDYYENEIFKFNKDLSCNLNSIILLDDLNRYFFDLYEINYLTSSCNKLFSTKIIKDNKIIFEEDMAILEDFKFVLDYIEHSEKLTVVDNIYYHYYNELSSSKLKKRPNVDYINNFKILDFKLREVTKKIGLDDKYSIGKINSMIFRYYITAIEKLFIDNNSFKYKYNELKRLMLDKEFNNAINKSKPTNKKLSIIRFLFKIRSIRILSILFWINSIGK